MSRPEAKLRVGDWVEVRSKEEILATLDRSGRLDGLPFMPQMFQYSGHRFQVLSRAHKTCDVVGGECRSLPQGIHLNIRCDGEAYGGCQQGCLIFWKQAWLKRRDESKAPDAVVDLPVVQSDVRSGIGCSEEDVWRARCRQDTDSGETLYFCQATRVPYFTRPLAWWDIRQYIEDYRSGNVTLGQLARGFIYQAYQHGTQAWRHRLGLPARWVYDLFQSAIGGIPFPRKPGVLQPGRPSPIVDLNLQRGDIVRVKRHDEILATISKGGTNRGLLFDKEMVPFCGKEYRVKTRVTTFVNERTAKLSTLKTPAVILEGVWCQSRYSDKKMFCPRSLYGWWREVWLEKIATNGPSQDSIDVGDSTDFSRDAV